MKAMICVLMLVASVGMAQAESDYQPAEDTQNYIEGLLQSGELQAAPSSIHSTAMHHPPAPGGHGWYMGCFASDGYGYVYDSYGYNAYYTQSGANQSCVAWSPAPYSCHALGCQVYYY